MEKILKFYHLSKYWEMMKLIVCKRSEYLLALVTFAIGYLVWNKLGLNIVRKHDTLDGEIVLNALMGMAYSNPSEAERLMLNGNVPIMTLSRIFQPMTALYSIFNPVTAYLVIDFIVRFVGFCGTYLLSRRIANPQGVSLAFAALFATSISYPHFLLSVAAIPLIIFIFLWIKCVKEFLRYLAYVLLVFIGANISLPLSGIFLLITLGPILYLGFGCRLDQYFYKGFLSLGMGMFAGNINLFYYQFLSPIRWHRTDWTVTRPPEYSLVSDLSSSIFRSLLQVDWYHVSHNQSLLLIVILLVYYRCRDFRSQSINFILLLLFFICTIYIFASTALSDPLRDLFPMLNSFQWDRFYFLYSSVLVLALMLMYARSRETRFRNILLLAASFQIVINLLSPYAWEFARRYYGRAPTPEIADYYRSNDYRFIRQIVGNGAVMSVGLDPMVAPMNGIASIDGYYVLYPSEYKANFRKIILKSMHEAGKAEYFDSWGNRLYIFYKTGRAESVDFCVARNIGATHVLSSEVIRSNYLLHIGTTEINPPIFIYQIRPERCDANGLL